MERWIEVEETWRSGTTEESTWESVFTVVVLHTPRMPAGWQTSITSRDLIASLWEMAASASNNFNWAAEIGEGIGFHHASNKDGIHTISCGQLGYIQHEGDAVNEGSAAVFEEGMAATVRAAKGTVVRRVLLAIVAVIESVQAAKLNPYDESDILNRYIQPGKSSRPGYNPRSGAGKKVTSFSRQNPD